MKLENFSKVLWAAGTLIKELSLLEYESGDDLLAQKIRKMHDAINISLACITIKPTINDGYIVIVETGREQGGKNEY
jgi:hypothetical protein